MGFFRKLLGKDRQRQPQISAPSAAAGDPAAIRYDPKLIETLHTHHAHLGALFDRIGDSARHGDSRKLHDLLATFKLSLNAHVLTENVRFYAYLEQALSDDAENTQIVVDFRHEMNSITRQVRAFADRWSDADMSNSDAQNRFLADYYQVGKLLERRLDSEEEQLFPLYQQT